MLAAVEVAAAAVLASVAGLMVFLAGTLVLGTCNALHLVPCQVASSVGDLQGSVVVGVGHLQLQPGTRDSFEAELDTEHIQPTFLSSDFPGWPK